VPAFERRPPAAWPWFLLLLLSLGVLGAIAWDVADVATSLGLRVRAPAKAPHSASTPLPQERRYLRLFIPEAAGQSFREVERDVVRGESVTAEVRTLLAELSAQKISNGPAPVPPDVRVRHVFLDSFGILTLDLAGEFRAVLERPHPQGEMAVAAVVNSLIGSFTDVKRVQILLDGQEIPILVGALDLGRPLSAHFPGETPAPAAGSVSQ